jgi:hypothetical protein
MSADNTATAQVGFNSGYLRASHLPMKSDMGAGNRHPALTLDVSVN